MATAAETRGPGPERAFALEIPATGTVTLDKDESGHLVRVRRVAVGAPVVLFDGRGVTRRGTLVTADARAAVIEVGAEEVARAPRRHVRLAVSLPEPARADAMVAGLAELGVRELLPLTCARTDPGRSALATRRAGRWARAAREALKVNGAAHALEILPTRSLSALLDDLDAASGVLLDPDPQALPFHAVLGATEGAPWILVGPEGGFVASELAAAEAAGVVRAQLGGLALRTGSAALAAAAVALAL